jgi:hypothetical protein
MKRLTLLLLLIFIPFQALATTIINYDFNNQSWGILSKGSYWTMQPTGGVDNTPAMRLEYSVAGTANKAMVLNTAGLKSNEFTIEMDVKMQGTPSGGSKFIKLFGSTEASKNNMTIGLDYSGNVQKEISYYMDTLCGARLDGSNGGSCTPTHVVKSSAVDMRGGSWGRYKVWVKRASPGVKDGETKVWWNGALRSHITNMDSNPAGSATAYFDKIEFGGYNHSNFSGSTWYLWIDNLSVSTGTTTSAPAPEPAPEPTPTPAPTTGAATIQWGAPTYSVSEGAGTASFIITRAGDSSGSASVNWGTFQNTATLNADYIGVAWTQTTFLAGETTKVVNVQIIADSLVEGDETFTLSLSSPTNATIGTVKDAIVTIKDYDTAAPLSPPSNLKITLAN